MIITESVSEITIKRNGIVWRKFVNLQKNRILGRLQLYNDISIIKDQLSELGDLTPYQRYKTGVISPILRKALLIIDSPNYGICRECSSEIPIKRLLLVPAALSCVKCTNPR